jgi:peptide/nickel transport system permease protein
MMGRYVLRRLTLVVPTLLGVSLLVFGLMRFLPGDVVQVMLGTETQLAPEQKVTLYRLLGLDAPLHVQYLRWIGAALRGDLGVSLRTAEPVATILAHRLPVTVELACLAAGLAWLVAVPLGALAAIRRHGLADTLAHGVGLVGLSVPNFWLATMLLLATSLYLRWQPLGEWVSPLARPRQNLEQMCLPVLSLAAALVAVVMRMTRSSMLEVLGQDYIRTARAKGVDERRVVARHALANAAIPVITVMGVQVGYLLGGAVVVESIFGLPGLGWVILQGIYQRDYPVVQGAVLFVAVGFVLVNLAVDLGYAWLDPRIRYE